MRAAGELLLLSCYELGHQPLGLASPLGFLERAGFRPRAIDLAREPLDEAAVRAARLVAISVPMHTALRLGIAVGARVKALHPAAHLCYYGLYAPLNERTLRDGGADSVLGGEYEAALVALCEQLELGVPPPTLPVTLARLDFAAPARRALLPLDRYARLAHQGRLALAGYTEASRGCLHRCRHCPIPPVYDGRFFVVPESVVLDDVRHQVAAGARHITFGDPDFLNGPRHALAIARALHAEHPRLSFDITAKVEHLVAHAALLPELARLGCLFIVSAVEHIAPRVLDILDKGHTRDDIVFALRATRAAGITLRPSLLPFTPFSTLHDYLELLDFIEEHDLVAATDPVQLSIRLLVPPGSLLCDHPAMQPHLGPFSDEKLSFTWRSPDPRLDELQRAVARLVEAAAERDEGVAESASDTFARIRALAAAAAGRPVPASRPASIPSQIPRLTEPWFC